MTIRVGTIVTQFDSGDVDEIFEAYRTCEGYLFARTDITDVCIGIVLEVDDPEQIPVKWLTTCKQHNTPPDTQLMPLNELWEIGQAD